jgi:hypothetical protein
MPCQQHKATTTETFRSRQDITSRYYDELESEHQVVQAQPLSLDEKCKKLEETIQRVATNIICNTKKKQIKRGLTRSMQK